VSKLVTIAAGPIAQHLEEHWQLISLNLSLRGLYAFFIEGSEVMEGCQFAPAPSHEAGRLNSSKIIFNFFPLSLCTGILLVVLWLRKLHSEMTIMSMLKEERRYASIYDKS
jgi:hypothetical protein